jgi:signal transduction histidine kinase
MSPRTARRLAWFSAWLAGCLVAAGLLLSLLSYVATSGAMHLAPHQVFNPLITLSFSTIGALIASRHPRNPIGWILCATGFLSALDLLALGYSVYDISVTTSGSLPGARLAKWLDDWVWIVTVAMPLTFLLLLFPDGRLISPRWRPIAWLAGVGLATGVFGLTLDPGLDLGMGDAEGQIQGRLLSIREMAAVLVSTAWLLLCVGCLGSLTSLIVRFRRASGIERDQVKWLVYAVGLAFLTIALGSIAPAIVGFGNPMEVSVISTEIALVTIILAIGIAIVRHHLYDIDLLINRTLVYGTLTVLIAGIYIVVVGSLGVLFQSRGELFSSLLATGVVAVCFQPVRERLQRMTNRLMYGERDDPYAVLSRLGERLEGAFAPDAMLATLVETIAQSLKLPNAAIALGSREETRIAASYGQPVTDPERFSLMFQREIIGQLLVGSRAAGEKFYPAEKNLLSNIARQAGAAVHATELAVDLQRSRVQLVTAREEERRRLRRDLHDGLGPTLAALHLQAGTLRRFIRKEPNTAEGMADELKGELKSLLDEIRRLAYGLRPPALDELGLVGAIQSRANQMRLGDIEAHDRGNEQQHLHERHVHVQASGDLQSLPAAVEVAAYHIVQEALLNSMRHAQASQYTVRLSLAKALTLEIEDNGNGLPPRSQAGVGILSMRERAAELGGWCSVETHPAGGTIVRAHLPVLGI